MTLTSQPTLVERLVQQIAQQIERHELRAGAKLASVRALAKELGVSTFTVAQAYNRLVARGLIRGKQGSGYLVRELPTVSTEATLNASASERKVKARSAAGVSAPTNIDSMWLVQSMFRNAEGAQLRGEMRGEMPGAGTLPRAWLGTDLVGKALRSVVRDHPQALSDYGEPLGYRPLREQLVLDLASRGLTVGSEQIVTTTGITHALDLVLRWVAAPGDTVLVEDPAWFIVFARLAAFGLRVVGVPRTAQGLDLDALESAARTHQPKAIFINSAAHNPTGHSLSPQNAHRILQIAHRYNFIIIEDDVSQDLLSPTGRVLNQAAPSQRLASLDGLERVVYLSGFSKSLASGIRVGYLVASEAVAQKLCGIKLLTGLTTAELGERAIYRVLTEGHYRTHCERLALRVQQARAQLHESLVQAGFEMGSIGGGMFLWGRLPARVVKQTALSDSQALAVLAAKQGIICAPGNLFFANQASSPYMRFAVGMVSNQKALSFFAKQLRVVR
jgi:DNA-binding transcriptional MocR family regulator